GSPRCGSSREITTSCPGPFSLAIVGRASGPSSTGGIGISPLPTTPAPPQPTEPMHALSAAAAITPSHDCRPLDARLDLAAAVRSRYRSLGRCRGLAENPQHHYSANTCLPSSSTTGEP